MTCMRLTFVLAFLLASFGASIGSVLAADTHIHASVTFKKALSASVGNDMDFGIITYELNHGGTVTLGTNGAVQLENGSNGLSLSGGAHTPLMLPSAVTINQPSKSLAKQQAR